MSSWFKEKHSCLYLQCTCVHFSQQAGMPTFQIVPTLHLNIALLALWGHHSRCKTNPLKQNTCTCVQLLVQYRHTEVKYKCKPSFCLKFMGVRSLWGKGGGVVRICCKYEWINSASFKSDGDLMRTIYP